MSDQNQFFDGQHISTIKVRAEFRGFQAGYFACQKVYRQLNRPGLSAWEIIHLERAPLNDEGDA